MALPLKSTLGEIRSAIQTRLGFGMAGQAGIVNSPLIDDFIRSAQIQLYDQFDWDELKAVHERTTGADQAYYDYPPDCNIERITGIYVLYDGLNPRRLREGINATIRTNEIGRVPLFYERRDQIELYPVPESTIYTLRFEYIRTLLPLQVNSDRTSIDSEIVKLHALANAKAHYRQPDAQTYSTQLDAKLNRLKARHRSKTTWGRERRYDPYDYAPTDSVS